MPKKKEEAEEVDVLSNFGDPAINTINPTEVLTEREILVEESNEEVGVIRKHGKSFIGDSPVSDTPVEVSIPKAKEVKEVIPSTLDLQSSSDVSKSERITNLMAGRLEADIPLTDNYWVLKNSTLQEI